MHNRYVRLKPTRRGFTLVEMMVVIAVIAILAAISVVIYTQVADKANGQSVLSSLTQTGGQVERYKSLNGSYPASLSSLNTPTDSSVTLTYSTNGSAYCLIGSNGDTNYYVSDTVSKPTSGTCTTVISPNTPAVVGTAGNNKTNPSNTKNQTLSVPLPSGTAAGALVILQIYAEYNNVDSPGAATAFTAPSGYTLAGEVNYDDYGWGQDMAVYYGTVASSGTTSYTVSFANEGNEGPIITCGSTTVVSGVSRSGNPFSDTFASTSQNAGVSAHITAPSFTPGGDYSLVMVFAQDAGAESGSTVTFPAAITKNWGLSGTGSYCAVGTASQGAAAATGAMSFTAGDSDNKSVLISAIRP